MSAAAPEDARRIMRTGRVLPYPPERVFEAIADPAQLARWWGPAGFTNTFEVFEFTPGGRWVFQMHGPDGQSYANSSVFDAIEPGRRVAVRHDCAPLFTLSITLTAVDEGTALDWVQAFDDAATADAVRARCLQGNEDNLDRLGAVLDGRDPA
ncbi:SRPBCC domain-containing protein [Nitrogeniibacter aestuarii]|uniref:SRPBCC domain-containing protein n=1 Tax=Nitrogeniibacter aestuarii TaxID=2815343 RepID=UPI001E4B7EF3|nr:SRPBCC domain-containing protein [Nitrogeniibacter aestuarii]